MRTYVTLAILSLGDVALERGSLVGTDLDTNGDTIAQAVADLIHDTQIINHASVKLVDVFQHPDGGIDVLYRVRTFSRALSSDHEWRAADSHLSAYDRKLLNRALETEKP